MTGRRLRILVVEDEVLTTIMIEDMLADLGHTVAASAASVDEALSHVRLGGFDAALLDLNLHGARSYAVADALKAKNVPYLFITAYAERDIDARYRGHPSLRKPFSAEALAAALQRLTDA